MSSPSSRLQYSRAHTFFLLSSPALSSSRTLLCIGMDATSIHNSRASPDDHLQPHGHHRLQSLAASLSPTLVYNTHNNERPSLKPRIPGTPSNILNSTVINAAGQSLIPSQSSDGILPQGNEVQGVVEAS